MGYKLIAIIFLVPLSIGSESEVPLSTSQLEQKFGQGYSVHPLTVDCVVSQSGERYDVVLHAKPNFNETLIIVRGLGSCIKLELQEFARIIFVDDYSTFSSKVEDHEPLAIRPNYTSFENPWKSTLNHPQTNCADPNSNSYCVAALESKNIYPPIGGSLRNEPVEKVIPFEFRVRAVFDRPSHYFTAGDLAAVGMINNISSAHPPFPLLTEDDSNVSFCNANNLPSNCAPGGAVSHPIHLHGVGFQVIDMGTRQQYANGQTGFRNSTKLPVVKDTVIVPSGGFVRLRFKSCNPGYWFFHCHFEYHMHVGMLAIIKVGNKTDMIPPPPNFPKCGDYLPPVY
ncbi:uncharacterized protein LOC129564973 [Sitodiplosis mosellana]|uniref:uncharacterized protein LOC129564973 n=1 Tax=Sitodiplosis mosellana TaxID=263140 RepID=UPI002444F58D|nr:uncharacterized protein LOC129564973 [Sitodiplosis mosellana]